MAGSYFLSTPKANGAPSGIPLLTISIALTGVLCQFVEASPRAASSSIAHYVTVGARGSQAAASPSKKASVELQSGGHFKRLVRREAVASTSGIIDPDRGTNPAGAPRAYAQDSQAAPNATDALHGSSDRVHASLVPAQVDPQTAVMAEQLFDEFDTDRDGAWSVQETRVVQDATEGSPELAIEAFRKLLAPFHRGNVTDKDVEAGLTKQEVLQLYTDTALQQRIGLALDARKDYEHVFGKVTDPSSASRTSEPSLVAPTTDASAKSNRSRSASTVVTASSTAAHWSIAAKAAAEPAVALPAAPVTAPVGPTTAPGPIAARLQPTLFLPYTPEVNRMCVANTMGGWSYGQHDHAWTVLTTVEQKVSQCAAWCTQTIGCAAFGMWWLGHPEDDMDSYCHLCAVKQTKAAPDAHWYWYGPPRERRKSEQRRDEVNTVSPEAEQKGRPPTAAEVNASESPTVDTPPAEESGGQAAPPIEAASQQKFPKPLRVTTGNFSTASIANHPFTDEENAVSTGVSYAPSHVVETEATQPIAAKDQPDADRRTESGEESTLGPQPGIPASTRLHSSSAEQHRQAKLSIPDPLRARPAHARDQQSDAVIQAAGAPRLQYAEQSKPRNGFKRKLALFMLTLAVVVPIVSMVLGVNLYARKAVNFHLQQMQQ